MTKNATVGQGVSCANHWFTKFVIFASDCAIHCTHIWKERNITIFCLDSWMEPSPRNYMVNTQWNVGRLLTASFEAKCETKCLFHYLKLLDIPGQITQKPILNYLVILDWFLKATGVRNQKIGQYSRVMWCNRCIRYYSVNIFFRKTFIVIFTMSFLQCSCNRLLTP